MAIAVRTGEETRQVQMVWPNDLVADDDLLRPGGAPCGVGGGAGVRGPVLLGFGRPGVDPVVLVKLYLVAAIRGRGSMHETLRVARVDVSIRRVLGYGLTEALPHHATLSYAQVRAFRAVLGV